MYIVGCVYTLFRVYIYYSVSIYIICVFFKSIYTYIFLKRLGSCGYPPTQYADLSGLSFGPRAFEIFDFAGLGHLVLVFAALYWADYRTFCLRLRVSRKTLSLRFSASRQGL